MTVNLQRGKLVCSVFFIQCPLNACQYPRKENMFCVICTLLYVINGVGGLNGGMVTAEEFYD